LNSYSRRDTREARALTRARTAARRGEADAAIGALRELAAAGETAACPSLAELLAFKGEWREVVPIAARLIAKPSAAYAGNVFDDMIRLLGRAGHETGAWGGIERAAQDAAAQVKATIAVEHLRVRYLTILERLRAYARGRGSIPVLKRLAYQARGVHAPDDELIMLWKRGEEPPLAERKRQLDDATANVLQLRPDLARDAVARHAHLFALAQTFDCPTDALERYRAHRPDMSFEAAVYVGRHLAAQGGGDEAWALIAEKLPLWMAADPAQVAPVVLVVDPELQRLMTPERCAEALRTPRG
jgi:hypothetical protein